MPTIHITIDDTTEALSIIAAALNGGYDVRVDLDEIDHTGIVSATKRAERDPLQRPFVDARPIKARMTGAEAAAVKARTDAKFAKAKAALAERRRMEAEERAIERGGVTDQQVYDARYEEAQAARIVECKACGAKVDHACQTPSGKLYGAFVHIDRIMDANTARGSHVQ
jgi:hypothetical protein